MEVVTAAGAQALPSTANVDAFRVEGIGLSIDGRSILNDISLEFPAAKMTALVGHNGSGKSTLLRLMARQATPDKGQVSCGGRPVTSFRDRQFAREVAYLPQDVGSGAYMTVAELVASGRYPWHGALGRFGDADHRAVSEALEATHLAPLRERFVSTLSGGERQRAWIAMMVAQRSKWLLLDEPTAALDVAHQVEVLSLLRQLAEDGGLGIAIVLHDINMAARFCDRIHALRGGEVVASGTGEDILRPETLKTIYGVEMGIVTPPEHGTPLAYVI